MSKGSHRWKLHFVSLSRSPGQTPERVHDGFGVLCLRVFSPKDSGEMSRFVAANRPPDAAGAKPGRIDSTGFRPKTRLAKPTPMEPQDPHDGHKRLNRGPGVPKR